MDLPRVGSVLAGKYEIVRLLGEGGMGAVFEAEHKLTQKRVAIKWLHREPSSAGVGAGAARLLREAQAASRIRHSNVVDVYDVEREGDAIFLVMEFLEGETLTRALARRDLPMHALIALILPALRGVAAAHKQGVIHRDIKPDNIFLAHEDDGALTVPKVLDFGISKLEERGRVQASLTRTGSTVGTPLYMSYEQLTGERDLDARTDVYAFGVILYQALTGQFPFHADGLAKLVVKIATEAAIPPRERCPEIPAALSRLIMRAIARPREQRTPSVEVLIKELERFATEPGFRAACLEIDDAPSTPFVPMLALAPGFLAQPTQPSAPLFEAPTLQLAAGRAAVQATASDPHKPPPLMPASERPARFEPSSLASSMDMKAQRAPVAPSTPPPALGIKRLWLFGLLATALLSSLAVGLLVSIRSVPWSSSDQRPQVTRAPEPLTPRTGELKSALPTLPSTRSLEIQADDWNADQPVQLVEARDSARERPADVASRAAGPAAFEPTLPTALGVSARKAKAEAREPLRASEPLRRAANKPDAGLKHAVLAEAPIAAPASHANSVSSEAAAPAEKAAATNEAEEPVPSLFRVRPPRSQEF